MEKVASTDMSGWIACDVFLGKNYLFVKRNGTGPKVFLLLLMPLFLLLRTLSTRYFYQCIDDVKRCSGFLVS